MRPPLRRHQNSSRMSSQPATMADAAAAGGTAPFLPDEIIIWEILVRLDPKTLFRCRAVRRSWRLDTSTRSFILAHHARQPALPIFLGDVLSVQNHSILAFDHRAAPDAQLHTVARLDRHFDLKASCDGLLVISKFDSTAYSRVFSVCNPATREHAYLRLPPGDFKALTMYPHRPTSEYRLLLRRMNCTSFQELTCGYIFALGSSQTPRCIVTWPEALLEYLTSPVRAHDSLYWYPKSYGSDSDRKVVIIVFDTIANSFQMMSAPIVPNNSYVFEMNDMLGMCSQSNATKYVDIRVLQNTETWELKYRIELPVAEIRRNFEGCDDYWKVDVVSVDGGVLLLIGAYGWLLHVDCDGKLIASFRRGRQSFCPPGVRLIFCTPGARLKQSLVQHTFFPALDGYAMNASPLI